MERGTTLKTPTAAVDAQALAVLRRTIRGDVLTPDDPTYSAVRAPYNAMHPGRPAIVIRASGTADVIDAVHFAREHGLTVAVRGGGHSIAGLSSIDGGLLIDLERMNGVDVDPEAQIVRVQGGALWGDVDRETQAFGLVVPGGVVSDTGVAGLTLGGGEGWVRRKHGLSCDSLIAAQVVCADGQVRMASGDTNADLFWALRGGGGNFGVVTHFTFKAYPLGPIVAFAGVFYPAEDTARVLRGLRDYCEHAPDEVNALAVSFTMPADEHLPPEVHGKMCTIIGGLYVGDPDRGLSVLQPLRELATPIADISQPMPFRMVNSGFDSLFPRGKVRSYWKSTYLNELSDGAIDFFAARVLERPQPLCMLTAYLMGGAINRVGASDTAYGERSAPWMMSVDGNWSEAADDEATIAWVRTAWAELHGRFGKGSVYLNFTGITDEGASAFVAEGHGGNLKRLAAIKARYDPENFFRLNNNVAPAK